MKWLDGCRRHIKKIIIPSQKLQIELAKDPPIVLTKNWHDQGYILPRCPQDCALINASNTNLGGPRGLCGGWIEKLCDSKGNHVDIGSNDEEGYYCFSYKPGRPKKKFVKHNESKAWKDAREHARKLLGVKDY